MRLTLESTASILAELGNETRLAIVRLLVRAGEDGLTVGAIQRATGVPGSTLSHHLGRLRGVGLVSQTRTGSALRCRADFQRIRATADFLIEECCAACPPATLRLRPSRPRHAGPAVREPARHERSNHGRSK